MLPGNRLTCLCYLETDSLVCVTWKRTHLSVLPGNRLGVVSYTVLVCKHETAVHSQRSEFLAIYYLSSGLPGNGLLFSFVVDSYTLCDHSDAMNISKVPTAVASYDNSGR